MANQRTESYGPTATNGAGFVHKILACAVPLVLMMVFVALSPSPSFTLEGSLLGHMSGEFWYCNTAVLWFGWRLGGETKTADQLPLKYWLSSVVIFIIALMLFAQSVWWAVDASQDNASPYATYYIQYVLLTYLITYLGHVKVGAKKSAEA